MQKMIGYAQPTSCQFSNTMDCNGNSWAHQQKEDQHTLENRCPELAKLLDMDPQTSAIAQLQRVAASHLPDISPGSLPKKTDHERAVATHRLQEPRSNIQQERISQSHRESPSICNNSVTTQPFKPGTTASPSISATKVSDGPVVPLWIQKITEVQLPLQNGGHLQNGEGVLNKRLSQNGWPNRMKVTASESKEGPAVGRKTGTRDEKEMEVMKDSQIKISEKPGSPIDLQMSCDEDDLDVTQMMMNDQYAEALRKYHRDMARYRDELEKHFLAKHGMDEKRKAEPSKGGPEDVILVSRGVQASEVTERDTLIAPAIALDLASGDDEHEPSSSDSSMVIPTTQTKMHLSHSTARNRFHRHFGNLVTCTTVSSDVLSPSHHQNTRSPLTESTSSPVMSPASSSQTPSPQSTISNLDDQGPGMPKRDKRTHPTQMQLLRFPSGSASCAVDTNSQLPPPLRQSDEGTTGRNPQQNLQPFSLVQPPIYPEVPPSMAVPGQLGGHPPPYPTGQTAARPPNQGHPSESGSSGSDPPLNSHVHPSKRRRRSSSGNRQAKRPKGQEVTLNPRDNVSQSGHTIRYRPEDQVAAHFEETYKKVMQRNARFSPPSIPIRHPWQPSISPYSGGMKQNTQQPSTRPTHSLLRDHLTRQPLWPFGQLTPHQGTGRRMPQPFHQDFNQFSQRPGGNRMPHPFNPENYNGQPSVNQLGPYGDLGRLDFNSGYQNPGEYQRMPPYVRGGCDTNQLTNHVLGPDSHHPRPIIGQNNPTYLPSEGTMQMFGGPQSSCRFPGFPMNGPPRMSRPDGMPNLTPTSEPNRQSLPARAQIRPDLSRDNTVRNIVPSQQTQQQDGPALHAKDNSFGSRAGPLYRFSPPERQQQSITGRPMWQDDSKQSNSLTQSSDVLDLSQPHQQEVIPHISKVHNVNKQRNPSDIVRMSPPESQQQEPVMPRIVSVTTERREHFPPTVGSFRDAMHHGRNQMVNTCPPLLPVSQVTAGQLSGSGNHPNKELVPSNGNNAKTVNPTHASGRPHHQPGTSLEAVSVSETTTLSQNGILSVPRLVRDERGVPRVIVYGKDHNASLGVSSTPKHLPPTTQEAVLKGTTSIQPGSSTAQGRREVTQMEQASSKTNSASVSSNQTLSANQRPMPALLRIPKIRKSARPERFVAKETSLSSSTNTPPTAGNNTGTSKQRDAADTIQRVNTTSSGGGHISALETSSSGVSGKDVSVPVTGPQINISTSSPKMLPNLVMSQVSSEISTKQQPSGPAVTGTSEAFLAAFPSLCPQLPTSVPLLSTGPATQQNQVIFATTVPSLQSLPGQTILAPPIVIPTSVSLINSVTVDQQNISSSNKEMVDHPQVVAGTVRSVAEESTPQINEVSLDLLRSRFQLEKFLDQAASGASGSTVSGIGGEIPAAGPTRIESGGEGTTSKEKMDGGDNSKGNKLQKDVHKEIETSETLVTPCPSGVATAVLQETDESEEEVITIPVASVLSSPEVDGSKDKSKDERNEDCNIFDQVATFVSNLEKQTDSSATTPSKASEERNSTASHSSGSRETKLQLNESMQKLAPDGETKKPTAAPSGRLKNCTLRLVPRRRSHDEEKTKEQGQPKHTSKTTEGKSRKDSHPKSSTRKDSHLKSSSRKDSHPKSFSRKDSHPRSSTSKEKAEAAVSSKYEKYYGFKKGRLPSHQHNTRFRVVCYHCENLMADNITYMDHVEEVIEKSCPATKIKKLCKICFKAQSGDLQQHIKESHLKGSKYVCQICIVNFSNRKDLKTHMKKIHQGLTMPYICKICLYQTSFHADLKYHFITTHRGSKALLCHFCTKVLYSSRSFLSHFTKHYARQIGVQCPNCKLLFLSSSACKEHMNNDHQKFHGNNKDGLPPYKSFYLPKSSPKNAQSCTKLVGTMSSLNEEVIVVPDEEEEVKKAWKCLECGGSYVHLAEHLFTEYKCQTCPYVTHCSSAFSQHVIAFHSSIQDAPKLHPVKKSLVFGGQLLRCRKCGYKTAFATNMAKHIVCCPEGVSVIDSFDYLRTRALKEIAMRGRIADYSDNVPEVIAVENID